MNVKQPANNSFFSLSDLFTRIRRKTDEYMRLITDPVCCFFGKKVALDYVETNVADHCNLKCKGCAHFANIVPGEVFPDLEQYRRDISRMSELFRNIKKIRLMGGEPLLNKQLPEFISVTRHTFPKADIRVVTNGLLLTSSSPRLLAAIKDNRVKIDISLYPLMYERQIYMAAFLNENDIEYMFSESTGFTKSITLKGDGFSTRKEVKKHCWRKCNSLNNATLCGCYLPHSIKHFNDYFEESIPPGDLIDIYDKELNGYKIKKRLEKHMDICGYCTMHEEVAWSKSADRPALNDWCVGWD